MDAKRAPDELLIPRPLAFRRDSHVHPHEAAAPVNVVLETLPAFLAQFPARRVQEDDGRILLQITIKHRRIGRPSQGELVPQGHLLE